MIRIIQRAEETGVDWIDVTAPTPEELATVAEKYGLHPVYVEDSLDPWHLPKFERIGDSSFLILRVFGEQVVLGRPLGIVTSRGNDSLGDDQQPRSGYHP